MRNGDNPQTMGKLVTTERPFTPKPRERHLYGQDCTSFAGRSAMRPSSSVQLQLIEEECGNMSPVSTRYVPDFCILCLYDHVKMKYDFER